MTSEEIDRLQAGRELDHLIAGRVMKWRLDPLSEEDVEDVNGRWIEDQPDGSIIVRELLAFSEEIEDAWLVVEKMKPFRLWLCDFEDYWQAAFLDDSGKGKRANAETPMLAICRAALKAKLMEVKDDR